MSQGEVDASMDMDRLNRNMPECGRQTHQVLQVSVVHTLVCVCTRVCVCLCVRTRVCVSPEELEEKMPSEKTKLKDE